MGRGLWQMETVHLIVDLAKCVGCYNCLMACKDEHVGNCWLPYTDRQQKHGDKWIEPVRHERGRAPYTEVAFVTKLCQHCGDAPCQAACPDAVKRREDGIVLLDPAQAKGNRALVEACPYGMISWNEELETAQKCTLCAHLLDAGWKEPRCVQACPLRALQIVKCGDAEFQVIVEAQGLKPLSGGDNRPRVLYKNLDRYTRHFIAGGAAYEQGGTEYAAAGAAVRLTLNGTLLAECEANLFGEFKFDHIPSNTGPFEITVIKEGFVPAAVRTSVAGESVCLELLHLTKQN